MICKLATVGYNPKDLVWFSGKLVMVDEFDFKKVKIGILPGLFG